MSSKTVIETVELTKKYGDFTAVNSLNLTVDHGEVFGLLGPNGAGKTTTILMMLGLTEPSSGTVRILNLDPTKQPLSVKSRVGYMPEQLGFYDDMTARENLSYIARLNGIPSSQIQQRLDEALGRVGLEQVANKRMKTYSRGMRQRLGVADVLIKKPSLIIMDEPTSGLDPEASREFLEMIMSLKAEGITILLSSHLLYQVQAICDRVGLFNAGKLALYGTVGQLSKQVLGGEYHIQIDAEGSPDAIITALTRVTGLSKVRFENGRLYVMEAHSDLRPEAAQAVVAAGGRLFRLDVATQSLDDIYTAYFKEVAHDTSNTVAS